MLNIYIPQPCHEKWNEMTPTEKGAFCAVCSKEVVDFSRMTDDEVKNYFRVHAGEKPCGRFRKNQLAGFPVLVEEQVIYSDIALWKKFLAAVVFCFGMFFSSCSEQKEKAEIEDFGITLVTTSGVDTIKNEPDTIYKTQLTTHTAGFTIPIFVPYEPTPDLECTLVTGDPITNETYTGGVPYVIPVADTIVPPAPVPPKDSIAKIADTCSVPFIL